MLRRQGAFAVAALLAATAACAGDGGGVGPDPIRPSFYTLELVDNNSLPRTMWSKLGGTISFKSATLMPYAVGRTIDKRLVNDRTGGGSSGGNTRDTTVARGQMMDIRIFLMENATGAVEVKDSTVVDVEVSDTSFIVRRPHPNPQLARVDTGYFVGNLLVVPTVLDYRISMDVPLTHALLNYAITR